MNDSANAQLSPYSSPGARFLTFPLTRIVLGGAFVFIAMVVPQRIRDALHQSFPACEDLCSSISYAALIVPSVIAGYCIFVRVIERRPVSELCHKRLASELGLGCLIGSCLFGATIVALWLIGAFETSASGRLVVLVTALLGSLGPAFFEELLFRGVLLRILEEALGSWIALAISALLFGLLHLSNPNATWQGAIAIALEAGVLLGAAFLFTRRLWLAIGLHATWNYVQGGVFGLSVSGTDPVDGLLSSSLLGPDIITGGAFGVEGSILAVAICLPTSIVFLALAHRRGHIVWPQWTRNAA